MGILVQYGSGPAVLCGSRASVWMKVYIGVVGEWWSPYDGRALRGSIPWPRGLRAGKVVGEKEAYPYVSGFSKLLKVGGEASDK